MKVLKFGGTSVGTVESLTNVKKIVEARREQVIVVVSALGGLTDQLIATANKAANGDPNYISHCAQIAERHHAIIDALVPDDLSDDTTSIIDELMSDLRCVYDTINRQSNLSQRIMDIVVSFGERMSSVIISRIIRGATLLNSLDFILTRHLHGKHVLEADETHWRIHRHFNLVDADVIVVPGFIARDADGNITNLGRGGSDYTAAILAADLGADMLEIWTDVNGFMTADPRRIPSAKIINEMTYQEAMELCNFGAKVIYPPTIYPVFNKNIPIVIKNTFNPQAPGTLIYNDIRPNPAITSPCGESSINDTCLVSLKRIDPSENIDLGARIFNALAPYGVGVYFMNKIGETGSTSLVVRNNEADTAVSVLSKEFDEEISEITIKRKLSTIAVVGEYLKNDLELKERVLSPLRHASIPVYACTNGIGQITFALVVDLARSDQAMEIIHQSLFET